VEHDDEAALRKVVAGVLADPDEARRRGENAQRLARELFSWDRTIGRLDEFVRQPYIRSGRGKRTAGNKEGKKKLVGAPGAYVLGAANGHKLPVGLVKEAGRRRGLPAQLAARSAALVKALVPLEGTRSRPSLVSGQRRFLPPELIAGHSHGQRFFCPHDGLSGIGLAVATFGRRNTCQLVLHLRSNPAAEADIHTSEVPVHGLSEDTMLAFRFPPVEDSAGRWFYLMAESPDGVPGDAVSVWATPGGGGGPRAQRYEDGLPAGGELVMSLEFNGVGS